jgi:hypothetical protein
MFRQKYSLNNIAQQRSSLTTFNNRHSFSLDNSALPSDSRCKPYSNIRVVRLKYDPVKMLFLVLSSWILSFQLPTVPQAIAARQGKITIISVSPQGFRFS